SGAAGATNLRNPREQPEVSHLGIYPGVTADFYHARLDTQTRSQEQDSCMENRIRVIVATNAFGMGIDMPDVRFVLHLNLPDSLDAYYQEAGRAGRDGKKAIEGKSTRLN